MKEFNYEELEMATESFSPSRIIGKGSHGIVYKGTLNDGKVVAIKKTFSGEEDNTKKLENEIVNLSSIGENPYIINLIGTSHDSATSKLLVIELFPNGSLHDSLHVATSAPLSWSRRIETILRLARALQFLHESSPSIIHRDIKSANILFDSHWNAKLADFGLAVRMKCRYRRVDSLNQPAGTIGYLDPCYTTPSKLSPKNDVFSFGVVLLEIISGRRAIDVWRAPASIIEWAIPLIKERRTTEICDPRAVLPEYMEATIGRVLCIAARCVSLEEMSHRPPMKEIVMEMEDRFIERVRFRFPIWTSMFRSIVLSRKWRKMAECSMAESGDGYGLSSRGNKILLREVLADFPLE